MIVRLKFKFPQNLGSNQSIPEVVITITRSNMAHPCDQWALIKSRTYGLIEGILHDSSVMKMFEIQTGKD